MRAEADRSVIFASYFLATLQYCSPRSVLFVGQLLLRL
jgi:hypothetical protein